MYCIRELSIFDTVLQYTILCHFGTKNNCQIKDDSGQSNVIHGNKNYGRITTYQNLIDPRDSFTWIKDINSNNFDFQLKKFSQSYF